MTNTPWKCSYCGTDNQPDARSCRQCGKWPSLFDLQAATSQPSPREGVNETAEEPSPRPPLVRHRRILRAVLSMVVLGAWIVVILINAFGEFGALWPKSDEDARVSRESIAAIAGATREPFRLSRACDLYVVPLDRRSEADAGLIVAQLGRRLPLEACQRPSMRIDPSALDEGRGQLNTGSLIDQLALAFRAEWGNRPSMVLGVTALDVFLPNRPSWPFGLNTYDTVRRTQGYGVVSTARLGSTESRNRRLETMALRDVGLGYFGLSPSSDETSALYWRFIDLDDLDKMQPELGYPSPTSDQLRAARQRFLQGS